MLFLPSDHFIEREEVFSNALKEALEITEQDYLVLFGIIPSKVTTGFGYVEVGEKIEQNAFKVRLFCEKPNFEKATEYVTSGKFLWNSGILLAKSSCLLKELKTHAPHLYDRLEKLKLSSTGLNESKFAFCNSNNECKKNRNLPANNQFHFFELPYNYKNFSKISFDYAVLEKSKKVAILKVDPKWSDLGSWSSIYEVAQKDEAGNALLGNVYCIDVKNSYIRSEEKVIGVVGVDHLAVIESDNAILVSSLEQSEKVKPLLQMLKEKNVTDSLVSSKVYRPWGNYKSLVRGSRFQVKKISVEPGQALSLQLHHHRAEHWVVVCGTAEVTLGEKTQILTENESIYIPVGINHRLSNPGKIPLIVIEVQTGTYLGEDDIVRFEDKYDRKD